MMKRFLTGVLSIIAGTALVLTSFAGACSEDTGSVNGPPAQETPSAAFQGPSVAVAEIATTTPEPEPEPEWIEATATAYCSCEICCGEWALNRPNGIVYTASGAEAVQGVTIAADWSIYPPGTVLFVEGLGEMIVQDRGGAIQGQKIDVYFESHDAARQFGRQNVRFYIVNN